MSVIEYDGLYEVSNLGRVRSWYDNHGYKRKEPLIIGGHETRGGYLRAILCKDKKKKYLYIHRLVCESFILGRKMREGEFCDHLNTIRTDNRLENLRVCSRKENMNNPLTRKRHSESMKNPLTRKKLSESRKCNKWAAKSIILRGVNDGSIYRFKSSADASRFFDYKSETKIGSYISKARKNNKRTINIRGEEFYFEQKGEIA